jgi:hypothetical protein
MRVLTVLMMGLLTLPVYATTLVDLFSAEVVLDGEGPDAEEQARAEGLRQVLVRASGQADVTSNPEVQKAMRRSGSFLSQISYGSQEQATTLSMQFNPPQVSALLTKADLPYWPETRSNLVVWLVQEGRMGREVLWEQSGSDLVQQLRLQAALRGLPVTIPVGDFEDVTKVSATDLWGDFLEPVANGSGRYGADAVLILKIQNYGSRNRIRWFLYDSKPEALMTGHLQPQSGELSGAFDQTLAQLVDQVVAYYAGKHAEKRFTQAVGQVAVDFVGLRNAEDFFTLERYLGQLQAVAGVGIERIVGDKVTFQIQLMASQAEFELEVAQSPQLRKVEREFLEQAPELMDTPSDSVQLESTVKAGSVDPIRATENVLQPVAPQVINPAPGEAVVDGEATITDEAAEEQVTPAEPNILFEWLG